MEKEKLKEYLGIVVDMEKNIYLQDETIAKISKEIQLLGHKTSIIQPIKPSMPIRPSTKSLLVVAIVTYLIFIFVNYFLNLLIVNFKRFNMYIKNYFSTCLAVLITCAGPIYSLFLKEKIKTER